MTRAGDIIDAAEAAPRAAYVHVPFCTHRCGYCNFTVVAGRDELQEAYLDALQRELEQLGQPREVDTLYLGGGTPTRLRPPQLRRLCRLVAQWHPLAPGGECTVEANPEDMTAELAAELAAWGATRLSLGAQSLLPAKLRRLERAHTPAQAADSVRYARDAGLAVAVDLIFAAPGETLAEWRSEIAALTALAPDHVSTYGLTYEKGTAFWSRRERGVLTELDEELQRAMYLEVIDRLTAAGFEHYEVSNFARPGRRSRHNQTYWEGRAYYAAGPGAARYVGGVRETNHRSLTTYLKRMASGDSPVAERERLDPAARARERFLLGLRRLEGVRLGEFAAATGFDALELLGDRVRVFAAEGLLELEPDCVRLTRAGLLVSDSLWPEFL